MGRLDYIYYMAYRRCIEVSSCTWDAWVHRLARGAVPVGWYRPGRYGKWGHSECNHSECSQSESSHSEWSHSMWVWLHVEPVRIDQVIDSAHRPE